MSKEDIVKILRMAPMDCNQRAAFALVEIAIQLAVMNEREAEKAAREARDREGK